MRRGTLSGHAPQLMHLWRRLRDPRAGKPLMPVDDLVSSIGSVAFSLAFGLVAAVLMTALIGDRRSRSAAAVTGAVVGAFVCVLLAAVGAAMAASHIRRFARSFRQAPFDGVQLDGPTDPAKGRVPRHWASPESLTDSRLSLAYSGLADDRAVSLTLFGEVLLLVSGAALGSSIARAVSDAAAMWVSVTFLVLGLLGAGMRLVAVRRWESLRDRYRSRYETLTGSFGGGSPELFGESRHRRRHSPNKSRGRRAR